MEVMERLLCKLLFGQLKSMGLLSGKKSSRVDLKEKNRLDSLYYKWFEESIAILEQNNYLGIEKDILYPTSSFTEDILEVTWQEWEKYKESWKKDNNGKMAQVTLVEATLRALPDILTGKVPATDILFPNSSMALVEGIYKNNHVADYFNNVVAETVVAFIEERICQDASNKIRIIEVGAGTGGTSAMVLKKLQPYKENVEEYCYTDISKAFLLHAEKEYGKQNPYLTYKIFNAEMPLSGQDIELGGYDIAIATNVLHATRDIRKTLRNVKGTLSKNGIVILNEINSKSLFTHLTFGLLEGWWLYEDAELRIPGCPGLLPKTWAEVLESEGFREVFFPAEKDHVLGQQIVIGESDGVVRQPKGASRPVKTTDSKSLKQAAKSNTVGIHGNLVSEKGLAINKHMLRDKVMEAIIDKLSESLKIDAQLIDISESFADYGVDSIIGVNLVKSINNTLGINLQTTDIFDNSSVSELAKYIISTHKDQLNKGMIQNSFVEGGQETEVLKNISIQQETDGNTPLTQNIKKFRRGRVPFETTGLNKRLSFDDSEKEDQIAIIGMSGRFAKSDTVDELWEHLANGDDLIEQISRWDISKQYEKGKEYCNHGSYLKDIDKFDPLYFNISGLEATYMDPQQRIFLEEAWKALEDAGYAGVSIKGQLCGVYAGCGVGDYQLLFKNTPPPQAFWGNTDSIVPSRISYFLDLQGPALAIDTACSSSLVSIHLASQALKSKEINMALAGGIFVQCTPTFHLFSERASMLSHSGKCYTFDDRADGIVYGEGVGVIVLKRLKDAVRDGDQIYGVIKGSGINQDGTSNGITAPSLNSQQRLECSVYSSCNINPEQIQMVEAHGTGTKLGDPIEYQALTRAFRSFTDKKEYCAIGSIKTNLGHGVSMAGIAGVIKILLSLKHKKIPPTLNFQSGNSNIEFKDSPFYVNTTLKDWEVPSGVKRCAAISGFGFSGTNAHIVIEEAPELMRQHSRKPGYLIALSARNMEQLKRQVERLIEYCEKSPEVDMGNMSLTLLTGRKHFNYRLACVVEDSNELIEILKKWMHKKKISQIFTSELRENDLYEQPSLKKYGNSCIKNCQKLTDSEEYLEQLLLIAELFTQGYELEYPKLFEDGEYSRISLPTYPFARDRYWISDDENKGDTGIAGIEVKKVNTTNSLNAAPTDIHPLLHQNTSDFLEQRFSSVFTGDEFFFAHHVVKGQRIMPGMAYVEMAREAVCLSAGSLRNEDTKIRLTNILWLKPIIVREQPVRVNIGLLPEDNQKIAFKVYTSPKDGGSDIKVQGTAEININAEVKFIDIEALRDECYQATFSAMECYEAFSELGIEYGPGHRGVEQIFMGEDKLLARINLPSILDHSKDKYYLHPALMDAALQTSIGFMLKDASAQGKPNKPYLPYALQELEIYGDSASAVWVHICYSEDSSPYSKIQKIDVDVADEQGRVCVSMKGFSSRLLEEEAMDESKADKLKSTALEKQTEETVMLTPVWDVVQIEKKEIYPLKSQRIVIIGGENDSLKDIINMYPKAKRLELKVQDSVEEIKESLSAVGQIDHIIWVSQSPQIESLTEDALIDDQNKGVLQCFRVIKALLSLGYGSKNLGWTVIVIKAQPVLQNETINPAHASLHGLIGSMVKEYPIWNVRVIDLEFGTDLPTNEIFSMQSDPQGNVLAYRGGEWYKQQLLPIKTSTTEKKVYRKNGVYVVIGGAGGIGEVWSEYMIKTYQANIVWIGRRKLNEEIQLKIDRLKAFGTAPIYLSADATDRDALQNAYEQIKLKYEVINGVIHSAIVLLDKSLSNMDEDMFRAGLSAKVDVSVRIAQIFQNEPLDFVMFFSSYQSFIKAPGQSNYASGCTFKDAFAFQLSKEWPCLVKVMNWSYWGTTGIVSSKDYEKRMAQYGIGSIEPDEAMQALENLLSMPVDQLAMIKIIG